MLQIAPFIGLLNLYGLGALTPSTAPGARSVENTTAGRAAQLEPQYRLCQGLHQHLISDAPWLTTSQQTNRDFGA